MPGPQRRNGKPGPGRGALRRRRHLEPRGPRHHAPPSPGAAFCPRRAPAAPETRPEPGPSPAPAGGARPPGPRRGGAFYPEHSRLPAMSSARPRAPGARLPPARTGSGSGASSPAAAAAAAAVAVAALGRRPPSPPPPRSSRDPPARAPRRGQHGGRQATAAGSPEPNLEFSLLSPGAAP